ncbi:hypothetical protein [Epibacterium ulvae]|uniref:hypothetical protein n=1 Tax=Epibacterium ulvae TaxID=1156985 RepID=UPI002492BEAC|nr:hypothetical protein [Epibacterium ulvae]
MNALIQNFTQLTAKADEFVCACCREVEDTCNLASNTHTDEVVLPLTAKYGENVCSECADNYEPEADDLINADEAYDLWAEGAA